MRSYCMIRGCALLHAHPDRTTPYNLSPPCPCTACCSAVVPTEKRRLRQAQLLGLAPSPLLAASESYSLLCIPNGRWNCRLGHSKRAPRTSTAGKGTKPQGNYTLGFIDYQLNSLCGKHACCKTTTIFLLAIPCLRPSVDEP